MIKGLRARMLSQLGAQPTSHEWVSLYRFQKDVLPERVASVGYFKEFRFGNLVRNLWVLSLNPLSSCNILSILSRDQMQGMAYSGWMAHVWVHMLSQGNARLNFTSFWKIG
jgi:hypothetical protein